MAGPAQDLPKSTPYFPPESPTQGVDLAGVCVQGWHMGLRCKGWGLAAMQALLTDWPTDRRTERLMDRQTERRSQLLRLRLGQRIDCNSNSDRDGEPEGGGLQV